MNTDILGKGFAFPLQRSPSGGIAASQQAQKIRESIRIILGTQHGERLMRPTFGCNLKSLVFAPNTRATAELARFYVEDGLATWEPRIVVEEVTVENRIGDGCMAISLRYRIKSTNEPQNMVYPFYLEQR
jgi:phage baseplate assembly protein W